MCIFERQLRTTVYVISACLCLYSSPALCKSPQIETSKLAEMFRLYYLPFNIVFQEGRTPSEIFPLRADKYGEYTRLVTPEELHKINAEWDLTRDAWKKKSLLLLTAVGTGESTRISQHLISHHIPLSRTAVDGLSISDRISLQNALEGKSPEIQSAVLQMRFLKSFMKENDEDRFNFFIFSPSWCESSKEYRALFEAYLKQFPDPSLTLHSVVIEDKAEEIFDSKIFKELFPNREKYGHETVPRFLALETIDGKTKVWEEAAALNELNARFFQSHRGFLEKTVPSVTKSISITRRLDPKVSLNTK